MKTERFENLLVSVEWTAKTEAFTNDAVSRLFVAYAENWCSVFEQCVFKRKALVWTAKPLPNDSVDG